MARCCDTRNPIAPRRATMPATTPRRRRAAGASWNSPIATTAIATSSINPAYSAALEATASGVGPDMVEAGTFTAPGGVPTPNANAPAVTCPSSIDTTRQVTVYVPLGSGSVIGTTRVVRSTTCGAPVATGLAPLVSSSTADSDGSGASEYVRRTSVGAVASVDPPAGSDDSRSACACAAGVPTRRNPRTTSTPTAPRKRLMLALARR
jgi:hypothetical protein